MDQRIPQKEVRRIIINDMVKKRNSIVSLHILWLSNGTLKWIQSAFEEDMKVMRRYTPLTKIGALAYEEDMFGGLLLHRVYY